MDAGFIPTRSELRGPPRAADSNGNATSGPSVEPAITRPSLAKRALRGLARLLIVFSVGVGTTLAWQSYGDAARALMAKSWPQLGLLVPQTVPVSPTPPEAVPPVSATSSDQQLALGLAVVRESLDRLTAQLAAGQQQMGGDIAKLQADEQEILHKLSAAPPRLTAPPAHKPAPVTPPPSPSAQPH